jgi:ornithine carbamoyltransferase
MEVHTTAPLLNTPHLSSSPPSPLPQVLHNRNLMSIADLTPSDLNTLLSQSHKLKAEYAPPNRSTTFKPLTSKTVGMIFQKRSTRTRVSTEAGCSLLGGHALFLGPSDIQLGVNESVLDTARVLCRFNDIILARVFEHSVITELAAEGGTSSNGTGGHTSVINALSDKHHPLQTLADLMVLQEHWGLQAGESMRHKTMAWVGDGNNILHDLALGCAKMGMKIRVATPEGYEPDSDVLDEVRRIYAEESKVEGGLFLTTVAAEAVQGSDVVSTDTWVSMGEEAIYDKKVADFAGYQVDGGLMAKANEGAVFLHCLPRHEEEVSDEVFYSKQSLVFPEAENRMWTVMSVMMSMMGKGL